MNPFSPQEHASAHARYRPVELAPVRGIPAEPGEIVGTVTVMVSFSCCRAADQGRPGKTKGYLLPLNMQYRGSEFLLSALPNEMDRFSNDVLRKVRAWEWQVKKAAEKQSQIHQPPGHQS